MGPYSSVRPVAASADYSAMPTAGRSATHVTATEAGARASAAARLEIARPVAQPQSASATQTMLSSSDYIEEQARQKIEAAQRVYTMTLLSVGANPMMHRPP